MKRSPAPHAQPAGGAPRIDDGKTKLGIAASSLPSGLVLSTDPARVDVDLVHRYLSEESYWARRIPREVIERGIRNSMVFGVYDESTGEQVAFARVITDRATFAYLSDVFVVPDQRGRGISKALVAAILAQDELQGLRRWVLATADAHELYRKFGFVSLAKPERYMEIVDAEVYTRR